MPQSDPQLLVTTDWLAKHLSAPDVRVLDGSWFLPTENRRNSSAGPGPSALATVIGW